MFSKYIGRSFTTALRALSATTLLAGMTLISGPAPVAAANTPIAVNLFYDAKDEKPGDGKCDSTSYYGGLQCTLRAAIMEANAFAGNDVITLPAGTYTLSLPGRNEDNSLTGDLDVKSVIEINGAGATKTIVDAKEIDRAFDLQINVALHLNNLTVTHGYAQDDFGGGVRSKGVSLELIGSTIRDSHATFGGGGMAIYNTSARLSFATIHNNYSHAGGGIYNGNGTMSLYSTTVSENMSGSDDGYGGGIYNDQGDMSLSNTLVRDNVSESYGGGIALVGGSVSLFNATIAGNETRCAASDVAGCLTEGEGAGLWVKSGTAKTRNSILAGNLNWNYIGDDENGLFEYEKVGNDCSGTIQSQGYNLLQKHSCTVGGNPVGDKVADPRLHRKTVNGKVISTMLLRGDSPAIDAGDPQGCLDYTYGPLAKDMRGVIRPLDGNGDGTKRCDIGAYEFFGPIVQSLSPASKPAGSGAFTLTVTGSRFTAQTLVRWKTTLVQPQSWTATSLTILVPAADLQNAGKQSVYVVTPGTGSYSGYSKLLTFTITP